MNMLVSGGALLLACIAFAGYELTAFRRELVRNLSIQASIAGANSASALLFNDPDSARDTLSALKAAPNILFAGIFTPEGMPLALYSPDTHAGTPRLPDLAPGQAEAHWFSTRRLVLVQAIEFQGMRVGTVKIQSDLSEVWDRLARYFGIVGVVLVVSLMAAFAFSSILQKATARPIIQLAETARIVSREKKYSIRASPAGQENEIAVLIDAFNEMLNQVQERDAALQAARDQLEQRVELRTAQLEAVNKELESFTYSVAHDLRAPLRHIQGFSDALIEDVGDQLDPGARKYLNSIVDSTRRMDQLIHDLLGLAQLGRQELRLRPVGLNSLAQDVVGDLDLETKGRNILWRMGDLPIVDCDPGLMKQVLYNLLSNAVKYTRPRDPAIIETGQTTLGGRRVLFVRDNGVGFNMKYSHKLFGVFERLHRREEFEGTGVGLATVQRIIHKHGGRIWAEAAIDRGTTFFFTIGSGETDLNPTVSEQAGQQ
jgi:signal transduction histidine kinase